MRKITLAVLFAILLPPSAIAAGADAVTTAGSAKKPARKAPAAREVVDRWTTVTEIPDAVAPLVARFKEQTKDAPAPKPTGLTRADYLKLMEGEADYFRQHQDANGAIIDPHKKVEFQYSTPCFALAAACVAVNGGRKDLVEPAALAMDWATHTLKERKAASAHEDFYPPQLAHALPLLKPLVDPARAARWEADLAAFDPFNIYRATPGRGNWNVVALSGEYLLHKLGIRKDITYVKECLEGQGDTFASPWGLYLEGPMPYDHFPRLWAADMIAAGYDGLRAADLRETLRRAALTSLFMQSPNGELPAGGRSTHHQWNEAEQAVTYEIYAARAHSEGDGQMAGVFKRAAHLALGSMRRWVRPSGEMWIVKNRLDPALRHGYDGYSAHSQYNLLPMAMLAIAYEHAATTEKVRERVTPAEWGGFAFAIDRKLHKAFGNAGGMYAEVDTGADLHHNPTGLLRVHRIGCDPQLGPSDGLTSGAVYNIVGGTSTTVAVGAAWKTADGSWRSLAEVGGGAASGVLANVKESPKRVTFDIVYDGSFDGPTSVVEHYELTPDALKLSVGLPGYSGPARMQWPVLADNGAEKTRITVDDDRVRVALGEHSNSFAATGATRVEVGETPYGYRNGYARVATAQFAEGCKPTVVIRPR